MFNAIVASKYIPSAHQVPDILPATGTSRRSRVAGARHGRRHSGRLPGLQGMAAESPKGSAGRSLPLPPPSEPRMPVRWCTC